MMQGKIVLLISLAAIITRSFGDIDDDLGDSTYTESSGYFEVFKNQSVNPGQIWNGLIQPNLTNVKGIFIVIEEMSLNHNDNLHIISANGTGAAYNFSGFEESFSLFIDAPAVNITLTASSDSAFRQFRGYYTSNECVYKLGEAYGSFSTPLYEKQTEDLICSIVFQHEEVTQSKLSITFEKFNFTKSYLKVSGSEAQDNNYTGSVPPADIIAYEHLVFNYTINRETPYQMMKFDYEHASKDSHYIKLDAKNRTQTLTHISSGTDFFRSAPLDCLWIIESEKDTVVSLKFLNLSLISEIWIKDGKSRESETLLLISGLEEDEYKDTYIFSSGNSLYINLENENTDRNSVVVAEVTMHEHGGYIKNSGNISIPSNSMGDVVYLLHVDHGQSVVVTNHSGFLTSDSNIYIYNDYSDVKAPIRVFSGGLPNYPIVSDTSKLMIKGVNFTGNSSYKATFKGISKGCYVMSIADSDDYSVGDSCSKECKWIVPPDNYTNKVISLHVHSLHLEEGAVLEIFLLDAKKTEIVNMPLKTDVLEFYFPSTSGFLMNVMRKKCVVSRMLIHATFEKLNGCNEEKELIPGKQLQIISPNYPNHYPLGAHCWHNITTNNSTKKGFFLLTFNSLNLAPTHCLKALQNFKFPNATVKTYSGEYGTLPDDILFETNVAVEFISQSCNASSKNTNLATASGFSLNITSADCGGTFTKTEGKFSTTGYPNKTKDVLCIWLVEVPEKSSLNGDSINIINYTLTMDESKNYDLKIYDGLSLRDEQMTNHSSHKSLLSKTNKLIVVYSKTSSELSDGILIQYHAQGCTRKCQNGMCLHEDWICNGKNDCGDNTDEINCREVPFTTIPPPPPPEEKSGISPVALGLGLPIAFILGIVAAVFVPPLYRRLRSGPYHQFRDTSADA